jgi:hypothetical protein
LREYEIVGVVRSLDYYELIAQVLPALFIAVLIEMRGVFDLSMRIAAAEEDLEFLEDPRPARWITTSVLPSALRAYSIYVLTCFLFALGELTALATVMTGTRGWLPWLAAPTSALSAVSLVLLAVILPFRHLVYRAWALSLERQIKRSKREQEYMASHDLEKAKPAEHEAVGRQEGSVGGDQPPSDDSVR